MESAFCAMLDNPPGFPLWEVSSLVFFVIPMIVMVVLYGRMGLQIRFRAKHTSVLGEFIYTMRQLNVVRRIFLDAIFEVFFYFFYMQASSKARSTVNPSMHKIEEQSLGCWVSALW